MTTTNLYLQPSAPYDPPKSLFRSQSDGLALPDKLTVGNARLPSVCLKVLTDYEISNITLSGQIPLRRPCLNFGRHARQDAL
jgi:hypothetical protein